VELTLAEFAFSFDRAEITDGNFAFDITNAGAQTHEAGLIKVAEDIVLDDLIGSFISGEAEDPEGVEDIDFELPIVPGQSTTMVFDGPLEAGRYVLLCFFPDTSDPERPPHAAKGMVSEFTVP
jgi:hypothetical protein